jgi:hypothetical protein
MQPVQRAMSTSTELSLRLLRAGQPILRHKPHFLQSEMLIALRCMDLSRRMQGRFAIITDTPFALKHSFIAFSTSAKLYGSTTERF